MQVRRVGQRAVLVEVAGPDQALALARWAREQQIDADEVVPAAVTVLFDGVDPAAVGALLADVPDLSDAAEPGELMEVPTRYDGADLRTVAAQWGCSEQVVIERHTSIEFTSLFCGFAPGFAYLGGLPAAWSVPRRADPRPSVPVGSVALAGTWCGIYPTSSPGGWQLIGRTDLTLWDLSAPMPATLAPGTRVRFVAVR